MRLIITEKNNSAKKIAEILSGGSAKADATYKVPYYTWSGDGGEQMAVGLKGHVMSPAFPDGYSNWQETDLHELPRDALPFHGHAAFLKIDRRADHRPPVWTTGAAGSTEFLDQAGGGGEIAHGVFGVDATFDGVAGLHDVLLFHAQCVTGGDATRDVPSAQYPSRTGR